MNTCFPTILSLWMHWVFQQFLTVMISISLDTAYHGSTYCWNEFKIFIGLMARVMKYWSTRFINAYFMLHYTCKYVLANDFAVKDVFVRNIASKIDCSVTSVWTRVKAQKISVKTSVYFVQYSIQVSMHSLNSDDSVCEIVTEANA